MKVSEVVAHAGNVILIVASTLVGMMNGDASTFTWGMLGKACLSSLAKIMASLGK